MTESLREGLQEMMALGKPKPSRKRGRCAKTRVAFQVNAIDGLEKIAPVFVVVNQYAKIAVASAVWTAMRRNQPRITGIADLRFECFAAHVIAQHEL